MAVMFDRSGRPRTQRWNVWVAASRRYATAMLPSPQASDSTSAGKLKASQAKFAHLKKLILDDNYLEAQKDALAKAFPMVELGEQRELEGEPDDEYSRYTSVGE